MLDPVCSFRRRRETRARAGAFTAYARLEAAPAEVHDVTATKARSRAKDATVRVSTTEPEARVMKLGDGGFRPAFNLPFATTTDRARVIVGVDATHRGSDLGHCTPMLVPIVARTGRLPTELLVDGGCTQHDAIDAAAAHEVTFLGPVPRP